MSNFKTGLVKARSNIAFIIGLTLAFGLVSSLESWNPVTAKVEDKPTSQAESGIIKTEIVLDKTIVAKQQRRALTDQERQWAKIAWKYFENNYQPETGMVNSVDNYPASTMWDTASYLLGLVSAQRLGIVDKKTFNDRVSKLLDSLASMDLFENKLPNKSYDTRSLAMVTYANEETVRGIGWSAIDVGRIMVPLNVLVWNYPEHTQGVANVLSHWQLAALEQNAEMYGTDVDEQGVTNVLQEGRLGYEEYAAKALQLIGMDLSNALDYEKNTQFETIYGIDIATDQRTPEEFGALNYVVSEPYVLDGLEYGWDRYSRELAARVYEVQQKRYEETGVLTAVSEDNIDEAPFFIYNTVFADSKAWNAINDKGEDLSEFRSVSTKAVFGFHALYGTDYATLLMDHISNAFDIDRGWYSGIYEASGKANSAITANTNGIILEALHYIENGPIMSLGTGAKVSVADLETE